MRPLAGCSLELPQSGRKRVAPISVDICSTVSILPPAHSANQFRWWLVRDVQQIEAQANLDRLLDEASSTFPRELALRDSTRLASGLAEIQAP
jgi:hypothetical protein